MHITEATLNHLDKAYEVEDGQGQQRDPYLKEMNIRTYLVIDPRVRGLGGGRMGGLGWAAMGAEWPTCKEMWQGRKRPISCCWVHSTPTIKFLTFSSMRWGQRLMPAS